MNALLILGVLTGLDNLRVGIGLGSLDLPPARRRRLALCFGLFEALMPLAGLWMGRSLQTHLELWTEWLEPAVLAACGLCVLVAACRGGDVTSSLAASPALFLLPPLLSIDNLLAGAGLAGSGVPLVLVLTGVGLVSAAFSFAGMALGGAVAGRVVRQPALIGLTLVAVSLVGLI